MVDRLLAQGKSWGGEMVILQSLNILYFRHGPLVLYLCLSNIRNPGWLQAGRVPHSPRPRRLVLRLTCHSLGAQGEGARPSVHGLLSVLLLGTYFVTPTSSVDVL